MTVCVAALCENRTIVLAASDRMLTAGDIQFEHLQPKVIPITTSIALLIAGDSSTQTALYYKVRADVDRAIQHEPNVWLNVHDVAHLYNKYYHSLKHQQASEIVLQPLGLDGQSFLTKQKDMDPQLVQMLASAMLNFNIPSIAALFIGIDNTGAHIYLVDNGRVSCHDNVGFAAIGSGSAHAESQLMSTRLTASSSFPRVLTLIHAAKKRAEVAPGVGTETDMCFIGPHLGSLVGIDANHVSQLGNFYDEMLVQEKLAVQRAEASVQVYVQEIISSSPASNQAVVQDIERDKPPV